MFFKIWVIIIRKDQKTARKLIFSFTETAGITYKKFDINKSYSLAGICIIIFN